MIKGKEEFIRYIKRISENLSEKDRIFYDKIFEDYVFEVYKVIDDEFGIIRFAKVNRELRTVTVSEDILLDLFWDSMETLFDEDGTEVALAVIPGSAMEDYEFHIETSNMGLEDYFEAVKRISDKKAGVSEEC